MPNFKPVEEQLAYLRKGVAEIIPENEFRAKLESSVKTGKPLRVKLGVDPTAPDLHLGHTVVMRKLKHFQDLGHTAIFLIGGFTAMVGDPTGQSETRPPLTREQVDANAKTYLDQAFHILDPKKTEVVNNADWLGKLTSIEMIQLGAKYRLARMLERDDFRSRLSSNQPISVHELFYPLLVAYDSVEVNSDVELGATEQKFNLLIGREIQREYGKPQQDRHDHAHPRRPRWRAQNVEEPEQLRGHHRSPAANVRQADVHFRRADVDLLRTAHRFRRAHHHAPETRSPRRRSRRPSTPKCN